MKIVVGYVQTDEGKAAVEWAIERAKGRGAEVVIVHSVWGTGTMDSAAEALAYRQDMKEIEERLNDAGIPNTTHVYVRGKQPGEDVIREAEEVGADMIVIGTRHRSRTGKLLTGSVALQILLDAEVPVVAVKARG